MQLINNITFPHDTTNDINRRGGGGLIQLVAYGAPDTFLCGNTGNPNYFNINDSIKNWFINNDDGLPEKEDIGTSIIESKSIFDHYPEYLKNHFTNQIPISFNLNIEKSTIKIQKAWRNSISNPNYKLCKNRLLNEFLEIENINNKICLVI